MKRAWSSTVMKGCGGNGRPRGNPPIIGIARRYSHLRKSGVNQPGIEPVSPWWKASGLSTIRLRLRGDRTRPLCRTVEHSLALLLPAYRWLTVKRACLNISRPITTVGEKNKCLESTSSPNEIAKYSWLYQSFLHKQLYKVLRCWVSAILQKLVETARSVRRFTILNAVLVTSPLDLQELVNSESRVMLLYATKDEAVSILTSARDRFHITGEKFVWVVTQSVIGDLQPLSQFPVGMLGESAPRATIAFLPTPPLLVINFAGMQGVGGTGDPRENPPISGIVRGRFPLAKIQDRPSRGMNPVRRGGRRLRVKTIQQRYPFRTNIFWGTTIVMEGPDYSQEYQNFPENTRILRRMIPEFNFPYMATLFENSPDCHGTRSPFDPGQSVRVNSVSKRARMSGGLESRRGVKRDEHGAAHGIQGRGKVGDPRENSGDQRHLPSRFPFASIRERPSWNSNPVRLEWDGPRGNPASKVKKRGSDTGDTNTHAWLLIAPTRKACSVSVSWRDFGWLLTSTSSDPMRVIEASMEQRRNEGPGEKGDPRENPPTNGIVNPDRPDHTNTIEWGVLGDEVQLTLASAYAGQCTWTATPDPTSWECVVRKSAHSQTEVRWSLAMHEPHVAANCYGHILLYYIQPVPQGLWGLETSSVGDWLDRGVYGGGETPLAIGAGVRGRGGVVVKLLLSQPRCTRGSIPGGVAPGFPHVGIVLDDAVGRRCFIWYHPFPPSPFIPALLHTRLASPPSALKTSTLRAARISPLHLPLV
ncbi:hypothetical protein PR048_032443 [Dryococelus australis]|uniref:Uncharacterized protein n=1 Tax=Dryococelus australis TaxID=614101 RepID=A0ABQ9G286_9NEOP|nr:hypothetical protein PR048_032443 [Dryococelus australis]